MGGKPGPMTSAVITLTTSHTFAAAFSSSEALFSEVRSQKAGESKERQLSQFPPQSISFITSPVHLTLGIS